MANNVLLLMEGSSACNVWRAIDLSTGFEATAPEGNAALKALASLDAAGGPAPAVPTLYSQLFAQTPFTAAIPANEFFSGSVAMTVGFFGEGAAGGGGSLPAGAATSAKQDQQSTLLTSIHNDEATALGQAAQLTVLDTIEGDLTTLNGTQSDALATLQDMDTVLANITHQLPDALGAQVAGDSLSVVQASGTKDAVTIADGDSATLGAKADAAATTDTGTFSLTALVKRGLTSLTTMVASLATIVTNTAVVLGITTSVNAHSVVIASDDVNIGPQVTVNGSTVSGVNQDIIASTNVLQYRSAYFQLTTAGTSCTHTVQGSNDGTNWFSVCAQDISVVTASLPTPTMTSSKLVYIPLGFKFLRIRCTTYGSGSPTGIITFSPTAISPVPMFAQQYAPGPVVTIGPNTMSHGANAATSVINVNHRATQVVVGSMTFTNSNATTIFYVKLFNKASTATLGTDVPVMTIPLMPKTTFSPDCGAFGIRFTTGLTVVATGAYADNDSTAITTAGDVSYNIVST